MNRVRTTLGAGLVIALALLIAVPAGAQTTSDSRTIVTFSGPVQLPGKNLDTGTYVFRLHDNPGYRHIVQVMTEDESQLLATLLAVPAQRNEPSEDTVITFAERAATDAPAVRYWFYPGRTVGHEFVYPQDQAMRIARASNEPVRATSSPMGTADEMQKADVTTIEPSEATADAGTTTDRRAEQTPAPTMGTTPTAPADEPESMQTMADDPADDQPDTLPQTASALPLVATLGLLSLGGAVALRTMRRRTR